MMFITILNISVTKLFIIIIKFFVLLHRFFRRSKQDEAACPDRLCLREDRKRIEAEAESSRWQSDQPETDEERNKINSHQTITIIFDPIIQ
jgi:hypothetical protein